MVGETKYRLLKCRPLDQVKRGGAERRICQTGDRRLYASCQTFCGDQFKLVKSMLAEVRVDLFWSGSVSMIEPSTDIIVEST